MIKDKFEIVMIGGSAGSIPVIVGLLQGLPAAFLLPIVLIIHRLKNVKSEMQAILTNQLTGKEVIEPSDKEDILPSQIYLAPQNYHLLFESKQSFSLDYSEAVHFSRPSIDVSFESAARTFGASTLAILLSGSNRDGAEGLERIYEEMGTTIIQSPESAAYRTMPEFAIARNPGAAVLAPGRITEYLTSIHYNY